MTLQRQTAPNLLPLVDVPEGQSGSFRIEKFTVTPEGAAAYNFKAMVRGVGDMAVEAGEFTALVRNDDGEDVIVMSDTPSERRDHVEIIRHATGHVLIAGLGLGVVLNAVCKDPLVSKVTVVELSDDVLMLVADHYKAKYPHRLEIVQGDIFQYEPPAGVHYGAAWFDIWDTIGASNLVGMRLLHKRYEPLSDWCESWRRSECLRMEDEECKMELLTQKVKEAGTIDVLTPEEYAYVTYMCAITGM